MEFSIRLSYPHNRHRFLFYLPAFSCEYQGNKIKGLENNAQNNLKIVFQSTKRKHA